MAGRRLAGLLLPSWCPAGLFGDAPRFSCMPDFLQAPTEQFWALGDRRGGRKDQRPPAGFSASLPRLLPAPAPSPLPSQAATWQGSLRSSVRLCGAARARRIHSTSLIHWSPRSAATRNRREEKQMLRGACLAGRGGRKQLEAICPPPVPEWPGAKRIAPCSRIRTRPRKPQPFAVLPVLRWQSETLLPSSL